MRPPLYILAVAAPLLACCGGTIQQESVPYRYRQSMVNDGREPEAAPAAARPRSRSESSRSTASTRRRSASGASVAVGL